MKRPWPKGEKLRGFFKGMLEPCVGIQLRNNRPVQMGPRKKRWAVVSQYLEGSSDADMTATEARIRGLHPRSSVC